MWRKHCFPRDYGTRPYNHMVAQLSAPLDAHYNAQATNYAPVRPARPGQIHSWVWKTLKFGQFESFWTCFNCFFCLFVFFNEGLLSNWLLLTDAFNKWTDRRVARKLCLFLFFYQIIQHVWGKYPTRGCEFGLSHRRLVRLRWRSGVKSVRRSAFFLPLLQTAEREEDPAGVASQVQVWRCSGQQPNGDSVWNGENWEQHSGKSVLASSARCAADSNLTFQRSPCFDIHSDAQLRRCHNLRKQAARLSRCCSDCPKLLPKASQRLQQRGLLGETSCC